MSVISESQSYKLSYFESENVVCLEWQYLYTGKDYRSVMDELLVEAQKNRSSVIIKMPPVFSKNPDDLKWESNYFFPELEMHDILNVYYILQENNDKLRSHLIMNSGMIIFNIRKDLEQTLKEIPGEVPQSQSMESDVVVQTEDNKEPARNNRAIIVVCILVLIVFILVILSRFL